MPSCSLSTKLSIAPTILQRRLVGTARSLMRKSEADISIAGIRIPLEDIPLSKKDRGAVLNGTYQEFARLALEKTLSPDDCVINVDGQFGYLSAAALRILSSEEQLNTYEGDARFETGLRRTFEMNGFAPRYSIRALGAETGVEKFRLHPNVWDVTENEIDVLDENREIQAYSLTEEIDRLDRKPDYLICRVNKVNESLFTTGSIERFGRMLLTAIINWDPRTVSVNLSYQELSALVSQLAGKGWDVKVWPGIVYSLSRSGRTS